jgi:hypothetical protein
LLPYAHATAYAFNTLSDTPANSAVWTTWPYSQWYNNFSLELASVTMINPGTGYTIAPLVIIQAADGDSGTGAEAEAVLGPNGTIASVTVTNPGSGYRVTPNVVFDGGNGISAQAYAVMQNDTVRSFRTVIKYDRYQYQTGVLTWSADGTYENGTLVRYDNRVWQANSADGSTAVVGPDFNLEDWTAIDAATLSGVNRTMGFYTPGVNEFGLDLGLLVDGTRYPGVQVWGDYFLGSAPISPTISCTASDSLTNSITCTQTVRLTVNDPIRFYGDVFGGVVAGSLYYINTIIDNTTFTISTTVNGSPFVLTTATGLMIADVPEPLDATYASSFTDQYLGLRPTDINVDGGEFIGPYEGHAPEELVNGSEYDTLDFRVYTRPGSDWTGRGHSFQEQGQNYIYEPGAGATMSWANVVQNPVNIEVFNGSTGIALTPGIDYTTDWAAQTITIISSVTTGDTVNIAVYEMGGGNQLFRGNYTGDQVGNSVLIPVAATEIYELVPFVNGQYVTGATWSAYSESVDWTYQNTYAKQTIVLDTSTSIYYRAIQTVPKGILITNLAYWVVFTPTTQSLVEFPETYTATDGISLTAMGFEDPQYSWSTAQTQFTTVDSTILFTNTIPLVGSMQGTNPANIVVTRNGLRLQPPEGIEWEGDDSSTSFGLPQRGGGYSQADIDAYTDIQVWVDNVLQVQNYGSIVGDYYVTAYDGSNTPGRQVVFFTPPAAGANILISVSTIAQYQVAVGSSSHLLIRPLLNLGDVIGVTSWNDTAQQNALTLVFVGPVVSGVTVVEGYDSTDFDAAAVSDTPGSFDYSAGAAIYVNDFDLGRNGLSANRLWVTLDGYKLSAGVDYSVSGQYLILSSGVISPAQVVAVTEFTESIVPDAMAFRVFQDMRGLQTTYRITVATTTTLAQSVTATADIIYVVDASMLSEPNISTGIFGVVTINGERIMYRERNTATNTISSLLRGTAGTGAAAHSVASEVYDMGLGNRLTQDDQDYIVSDTSIGDGSTTIFYAPNIEFDLSDSAFEIDSLEVYVGGNRARKGYQAGSFVTGETYTIASIGNTDWYAIGLPDDQYPAPGVVFTATGAGSGTGIAGTSLASHYYQEINYDPITVQFITADDLPAPASGVEVVILQRRGVTWYAPGVGTPSNGEPLQLTETAAARFLRGL